jgi:hypothetical protein
MTFDDTVRVLWGAGRWCSRWIRMGCVVCRGLDGARTFPLNGFLTPTYPLAGLISCPVFAVAAGDGVEKADGCGGICSVQANVGQPQGRCLSFLRTQPTPSTVTFCLVEVGGGRREGRESLAMEGTVHTPDRVVPTCSRSLLQKEWVLFPSVLRPPTPNTSSVVPLGRWGSPPP